MERYTFKCWTFRRVLELWIWWTEDEYNKEIWDKQWINYNTIFWLTFFDQEYNTNVIWLKSYDLDILVYELFHCVDLFCEQCWVQMNGEPPAYMYEELFCKIRWELWDKFKLWKDAIAFYCAKWF